MDKILLMLSQEQVTNAQLEEIKAIAPVKDLLFTLEHEEIDHFVDDIEVAAGWVPRELLTRLKNLRWFQQWGAGADWLMDHPEMAVKDFILTNMSGLHAIPISEHIFSFMLAFARDLPRAVMAQERGEWSKHELYKVFELAGATMVLIGVGAIGARTAQIANAMGMRVLGVRRNPEIRVTGVESMFGPADFKDILSMGDFVVLTVPLTPETRGMIGEQELKTMKPSAYIINIGRGGTIQEESLVKALQEGRIAGAGLDVFETEPLAPESPLWALDNVIITPHFSGLTPYYAERGLEIFKENLRRYQAGKPLKNVVDKVLTY
jgi:phosphoglycerate dehydrogenase-like enzyme